MITTVDGLRCGQLVKSIAGRDVGQFYLIIKMLDDRTIAVTDGKKHPMTKPKKKNLKHVLIGMFVATEIEEAVEKERYINDTQVLAAIHRLKNQLEEGDRLHG